MDLIKIKSSWSAKDTIKKMKRQDTDREKIFANYVSVGSRMCKELSSSTIRKLKLKKRAKYLNRHFTKKRCGWPMNTGKHNPYHKLLGNTN